MTAQILDCGHAPSDTTGPGTGYGTDRETGNTFCYDCATAVDLEAIATAQPGDAITFYLSGAPTDGAFIARGNRWNQDTKVTNWPGREVMRLIYIDSPSEYHSKRYARAVDALGREWYGVGPREAGTYMTFRPVTGTPYLPTSKPFVRAR